MPSKRLIGTNGVTADLTDRPCPPRRFERVRVCGCQIRGRNAHAPTIFPRPVPEPYKPDFKQNPHPALPISLRLCKVQSHIYILNVLCWEYKYREQRAARTENVGDLRIIYGKLYIYVEYIEPWKRAGGMVFIYVCGRLLGGGKYVMRPNIRIVFSTFIYSTCIYILMVKLRMRTHMPSHLRGVFACPT